MRAPLAVAVAALAALVPRDAGAGTVAPRLAARLAAAGPEEEVAVIVRLAGRSAPTAPPSTDRRERARALARTLRVAGAASRAEARARLASLGARGTRDLWAIGALAARVRAARVAALALEPSVESVGLDGTVLAPGAPATSSLPPPAGWNLEAAGAPALWSLGHTGGGVVVASLDTGVDVRHPDLAPRWRGGVGGWLDPHGEHAAPHDASGHGTQTMGIMVGGAASGAAIGMAPDARWIAVKLFDDAGRAQASDIHLGFQWLLDPDGDPDTADAPDVVSASWGLLDAAEPCVDEFEPDLRLLRSAGIAVVFAAGNGGPEPSTGVSPANGPGAFSVGAVDGELHVAAFSSRGPSQCGGGTFPRVVAPGAGVTTADLAPNALPLYATVSGTSFAAAHVAGAMALLAGAFPAATVPEIEDALVRAAADVGETGVDDAAGAGLVQARAAHDLLAAPPPQPGSGGEGGGLAGCSSSAAGASLLALLPALAAAARRHRPRP